MMHGILKYRSHGLDAEQIAKRIVADAADNPCSDNAICANVFIYGGRG